MSDQWLGIGRLLWRTRRGRRAQDPSLILRDVTRGADKGVGLKLPGRRVLLLTDPALSGELLTTHAAVTTKGPGLQLTRNLLGDGLLTSEGDDHRRARRLVAPAFSPRRLAGYTDMFATKAQQRTASWHDGARLDMHREMATLTLQIVGETLLGLDLTTEAPQVREGLEAALEEFGANAFALPSASTGLRRRIEARALRSTGPAPSAERAEAGRRELHQLVDTILDQRRANPTDDRGDVVSALIAASQERDGLTDQEVHDHVITLLLAGHETTANALSWTLYLLGRHPDVQKRLQAEADELGGRLPTFDDISSLTYTRAVISEGIRLFPPAWMLGRELSVDLTIGDWQVPAGTVVATSPLLLHHDRRWWPDPESFDPDRWLDERRDAVPKYAYLPFGTGPRSCIGEQFAWTEAIIVLAVLAGRWHFDVDAGYVPQPQYRVTLRPGNGVPMTLHARTDAPPSS